MSVAASASLLRTIGSSMSRDPLTLVSFANSISSSRPRRAAAGHSTVERSKPRQGHGDVPAAVHLADDFPLVDTYVIEEDLVEGVAARGADDGPDLDARVRHVAQEHGNAPVLWGLGIGAGQHEETVGVVGAAGPYLLAADHVVVAVLDGTGLEGSEVGARAGLAETLAPVDPSLGDGGEVLALLLLGAVHHERGPEHANAEGVLARGAVIGHLLVEDELRDGRRALAAVLLGPAEGEPAAVGELAAHSSSQVGVFVSGLDEAVAPLARQFLFQEGAELFPEGVFLFGEFVLHVNPLPLCPPLP